MAKHDAKFRGTFYGTNDATGYQGERTVEFTASSDDAWVDIMDKGWARAYPEDAGNGGFWLQDDEHLVELLYHIFHVPTGEQMTDGPGLTWGEAKAELRFWKGSVKVEARPINV